VNGVEAEPASGTDFVFDMMHIDDYNGTAHSMERSAGPFTAGTYIITLQWITVSPSGGGVITFTLDDWSMTVERISA
jgi:hypothetical protein